MVLNDVQYTVTAIFHGKELYLPVNEINPQVMDGIEPTKPSLHYVAPSSSGTDQM